MCIGCGNCVVAAPANWLMDIDTGKAILLGSIETKGKFMLYTSDSDFKSNQRAANSCPVKIIEIQQNNVLENENKK